MVKEYVGLLGFGPIVTNSRIGAIRGYRRLIEDLAYLKEAKQRILVLEFWK